MTKEELKQRYSMKEIVEQYGFRPNRAGFIRCPFHTGDRDASLKIYEKDFHCFGCGANGDIFDFVQRMDGVSFREAFLSLGGTYRQEKPWSFSQRMARYRREKAKEQRKKEQHREEEKKRFNLLLIGIYRKNFQTAEPFSDAWCDSYNAMQYQLYVHGALNGISY